MSAVIRVQTYSGRRADERPVRFLLGDDWHDVASVEDHWYEPDAEYFKVKTPAGKRYVLRLDDRRDWTLASAPDADEDV